MDCGGWEEGAVFCAGVWRDIGSGGGEWRACREKWFSVARAGPLGGGGVCGGLIYKRL